MLAAAEWAFADVPKFGVVTGGLRTSCIGNWTLASAKMTVGIHERQGAGNFALLRKLALSLLKQNPTKDSIARKRKAAALDVDFLAEIMAGAANLQKI